MYNKSTKHLDYTYVCMQCQRARSSVYKSAGAWKRRSGLGSGLLLLLLFGHDVDKTGQEP